MANESVLIADHARWTVRPIVERRLIDQTGPVDGYCPSDRKVKQPEVTKEPSPERN